MSDDIITPKLLELGTCSFETVFTTPCELYVTWHISCVTCHMSPITCHIWHVFNFFCWEESSKNGAASGWRVCHPLGTPCLVSIRTTIVVYSNSIDSLDNVNSATYFRFLKISNFYIFEIRTFIIHTFVITPLRKIQLAAVEICCYSWLCPCFKRLAS